jgi:tRNA dimethylallyltransferase
MAAAGLREEVQALLARGYEATLPALMGIGYRQFVGVARGQMTEAEAVRLMARDTVRYAKRQWTWFLREPDVQWIDVDAVGGADGVARAIEERARRGGIIE